jgi:hypothetical protein
MVGSQGNPNWWQRQRARPNPFMNWADNVINSSHFTSASKIYNSSMMQAGVTEVKFGFGFGKEGLFSRSTLDPLIKKGSLMPTGRMAQARGYAAAFRNAPKGATGAVARRAGMRALGPAYMAYSIGTGYKEGGVFGAVKSGLTTSAEFAVWGMARHAAGALLGSAATPIALGVAAVAGIGYGSYKALEHGNKVRKRLRKLEMGGPVVDPFGTGATMRNRSLNALQNSQINGRSAFGSEAALMHVPTMR